MAQAPQTAKQVGFHCEECEAFFQVDIPYGTTPADRSALMTAATSYHRGVCKTPDNLLPEGPNGEAPRRILTIVYPRG